MSAQMLRPELGEVFIAHWHQLQGVARKITGSAELADDVMQDSYLRLVQSESSRAIDNPMCYCCQVVRNVAVDYHRKQAVEATYRVYTDGGELPQVLSPVAADQGLHEGRVLNAVIEVLESLPPRIKHVFELSRLSGLTQREIGTHLGCSATLVNFMIKEAMEALSPCRILLDGD